MILRLAPNTVVSGPTGLRISLQQAIHIYLASRPEIHAAIYDERKHKAGGHSSTIALTVLFGRVEWFSEFRGIEAVQDRWLVVETVPGFGCDGPDDSVPFPIRGHGRSRPGVGELHRGSLCRCDVPICDSELAQIIVAGGEVGVAIPVGHRSVAATSHLDHFDEGVTVGLELAHAIAIDHIDGRIFGRLQKQVAMGSRLIR